MRCKCVGDSGGGWRVSCMVHCKGMPILWCVCAGSSVIARARTWTWTMMARKDIGMCAEDAQGFLVRGSQDAFICGAWQGRGEILLYRDADERFAEGLRAEFSGCELWEADATSKSRLHRHLRGLTPLHCSRELEVVGGDSGASTCAWDWSL